MAADARLVCSSDDDHDSLPKTEFCSFDPEAFELEYLHFNGDKLLGSKDLDSLKGPQSASAIFDDIRGRSNAIYISSDIANLASPISSRPRQSRASVQHGQG